jgi:hypothetical protein
MRLACPLDTGGFRWPDGPHDLPWPEHTDPPAFPGDRFLPISPQRLWLSCADDYDSVASGLDGVDMDDPIIVGGYCQVSRVSFGGVEYQNILEANRSRRLEAEIEADQEKVAEEEANHIKPYDYLLDLRRRFNEAKAAGRPRADGQGSAAMV